MTQYNERPKNNNRPNPTADKEKLQKTHSAEKKENPDSSGSQDARRHEGSEKHGKR